MHDLTTLGPMLLQITGVALRQSIRLTDSVCTAAASSGPPFAQIGYDLDNELATLSRPNGNLSVALDPLGECPPLAPAAQLLIRHLLDKAPVTLPSPKGSAIASGPSVWALCGEPSPESFWLRE